MPGKLIGLLLSAALLSACAVTQETRPAEVQLDGDIAKAQASALSAAVASAGANDGVEIASAMASVGDVAAALLPPTKKGGPRRLERNATTCTCDAASRSCTFEACSIGNATVSGSLSWSDGRITCNGLSFAIAATSAAVGAASVTVDCALTYATGRLAGDLRTTGSAVVSGVTYEWNASLVASDVTFTTRAFTAGSITVAATVTTSDASGDNSYAAKATMSLP